MNMESFAKTDAEEKKKTDDTLQQRKQEVGNN